ncbi:MAG: tRNA preQ1(34) S-adenosylmethionine ribosyltransferase-isomerase QueA [bacterium]|nr:tRNA preQ1(34) S-adenosylmethionine ribosyltransferase-isomerase QueA [bacterium]
MTDIKDFDYVLPEELIAAEPKKRGESRLLIVDRGKESFTEAKTKDIPSIIGYPVLIARNITRVVKTRFYANRKTGGKVEFLILNPYEDSCDFFSLIKRSSKICVNDSLDISPEAKVKILGRDGSVFKVRIETQLDMKDFFDRYGHTPLPPYIKREDSLRDENDYQTVYASVRGSSAAPTAGLHFSEEMIKEISSKGGEFADIILHVGLGTFESVKENNIEEHRMHSEFFSVGKKAAETLSNAKKDGVKILSVGTTTLRVLETVYSNEKFEEKSGMTDIFIHPPMKIRSADILLTNFHLPKSTLLMLVSSFAGRDLILDAYRHAVKNKFRFFSYGDAMLIL